MYESCKTFDDVKELRLKICEECEFRKLLICGRCGCVINLKVKLARAKCPIDKWVSVSDELQKQLV